MKALTVTHGRNISQMKALTVTHGRSISQMKALQLHMEGVSAK